MAMCCLMTQETLVGRNDELENEQVRVLDAGSEGKEEEGFTYFIFNVKAFLRIIESTVEKFINMYQLTPVL